MDFSSQARAVEKVIYQAWLEFAEAIVGRQERPSTTRASPRSSRGSRSDDQKSHPNAHTGDDPSGNLGRDIAQLFAADGLSSAPPSKFC